jgi:predicted metal-dependent phosphoesterase TrpH
LKVDFHTHTYYSPDSTARVEDVLRAAHRHGLGRVVITDHNRIGGALKAAKLEPDFVIIGEEIKTTYGELLTSFVKEEIPANLDPFKTIELLKSQNAFISVSHPMDFVRCGWPLELLKEIVPLVDAIEVGNARVLKQNTNEQALSFANEYGLAYTAGSDAHDPYEVGRMALDVPEFSDADGLREVIRQGRVTGTKSHAWVHLFSVQARFVKRLVPGRYRS